MSQGRGLFKTGLFVVCLVATIGGLINTYADNADVISQAEAVACGKPNCSVRMTRMSRGAFGQSFSFQTDLKQRSAVDVECSRALVLFGEYSCKLAP